MIPSKKLIETINKFQKKRNNFDKNITKETWTLDHFTKWNNMNMIWSKLEDLIELEMLPFVEENEEDIFTIKEGDVYTIIGERIAYEIEIVKIIGDEVPLEHKENFRNFIETLEPIRKGTIKDEVFYFNENESVIVYYRTNE